MHTTSGKYQLTLHSLSKIQLKENNLSKIEMKCISQSCETQFTKSNFPLIRRHFKNNSRSHHPEIASVLFASNHFENQLPTSPNNSSQSKRNLDIYYNYINKKLYNKPSKKRITRVRFIDSSRTANQPSTSSTESRAANQPPFSPSNTCAASPT